MTTDERVAALVRAARAYTKYARKQVAKGYWCEPDELEAAVFAAVVALNAAGSKGGLATKKRRAAKASAGP
jgi:hypothetical protein